MAMYELNRSIGSGIEGTLSRIINMLANAISAMQYARMMQVMSQMSDNELKSLGLTRADLPRHARACIFGSTQGVTASTAPTE
ncbi:MAG: hypothetical protein ACR2PG_04440 [Hyphomicrobiaceae bacterium]